MNSPKSATVVEVGPRDGFQMEKRFIETDTKIEIINALIKSGIKRIEATSFISPRAIPQMRDASEVVNKILRPKDVFIEALVPNPKGGEDAAQARVDGMRIFLSASESHNRKNVNRTIEESLSGFKEIMRIAEKAGIPVAADIAVAFGCPFEGDISLDRLHRIADRMLELGVRGITLGDTTGMATPLIVRKTCESLLKAYPGLALGIHLHNTRGIGLVNVYEALSLGLTNFESSVAGLGGCPFAPGATGNVCTEDMVYLFHELGIQTGIDLSELIKVARKVEQVIGRPLPGQVMKAGARLDLHSFAIG
ncbi:MAG: hydroxymethylglutaryl-CoA lyase [Deltaproteobacteria bacterium SM23_61]|nr:MAG: hydroxymethylglutaryl-CoA lyase [Deltaproteobacteria bacterium SM23_61]